MRMSKSRSFFYQAAMCFRWRSRLAACDAARGGTVSFGQASCSTTLLPGHSPWLTPAALATRRSFSDRVARQPCRPRDAPLSLSRLPAAHDLDDFHAMNLPQRHVDLLRVDMVQCVRVAQQYSRRFTPSRCRSTATRSLRG